MPNGNVNITVLDGGATVIVPAASVAVLIGCSSAGTVDQVVATTNANTLQTAFGFGPLVEAGALICQAGGTVLGIRATTVTSGTATAVAFTGTGTSVVTVTGTPFDDYLFVFKVVNGGTIGTTGITFQLSVDAGRNFGPVLRLGTAVTFAVTGTGLTLAFAAGTLVTGDTAKFSTTAPLPDSGSIGAALTALANSPYAQSGWGSALLTSPCNGALASTLQTDVESLATTNFIYTRLMVGARDALIPTAFSGSGENEATWMAAIETDFSAVSARRILATGGHYNMPSPFPVPLCGSPAYRRPLSWALAARQVTIPPQRHAGRVRDGSLSNIVVNPTSDPADGFVYHDEFNSPGLESARFCAARKRKGRPGYFISQPKLMSPPGSVFEAIYLGNVIDIACDITQQTAESEVNDDLLLNSDGTLAEKEAKAIETTVLRELDVEMTSKAMVSAAQVTVSRTQNVRVSKAVVFAVTVESRGYILEADVTVGFATGA